MKKTIFLLISVLIIVYIILSILSLGGEYAAEKLLHRAVKINERIAANPDVVPPALFMAVERNLEGIIKRFPNTKTAKAARLALAEFYVTHKKFDGALLVLDGIINSNVEDRVMLSKAHFLKGNVYEKQNQWSKALVEYKTLRDEYKETSLGLQAPIYIGNYYRSNGRDAEAAKTYNEAVIFYEKLERQNRGKTLGYLASNFLMQSYVNLRKYEEAGKVIENAIDNYPSKLTYLQHAPNVETIFVKILKNPQKAIKIYEKIKEKTDDDKFKEFLEKKINALSSGSQN